MKKFIIALSIMWEHVKSFVLAVLIGLAIIIALCSIIHNVFKIREIYQEDRTGYKNLISVSDNRMNARTAGYGEQTVVILPDVAECSPIVRYKKYAEALSSNYKVVTLEYFGYGFSLSTKEDRNNFKFAQEIKSALDALGVPGPYIFLATGTSSMYAYTYSNLYPDDVQKLVIVDGIYPKSLEDEYTNKYVDDYMTNGKLTFFAEFTGYARILSYVSPETFHIDQMKDLGFSKSDIQLYRKMIANRYYTGSMKKEIKELKSNMQLLQNYKYPESLEVRQVLSSGYVEEVNSLIKEGLTKTKLEDYAKGLITNPSIQTVTTVEGGKSNLSFDNPQEVADLVMN